MNYYTLDSRIYQLDQPITGATKLTNIEGKRLLREQAIADLQFLKPNQEICTLVRKVSASGMSRTISLFAVVNDQIKTLDYLASLALDWRLTDNGIRANGCGLDVPWHTVDCLSRVLKIELTQRHL